MNGAVVSTFGRTLALVATAILAACDLIDDPIAQAGRGTKEVLESYEPGQSSKAIQAWLSRSHGEAPGSEVMNVFVRWAVENRDSAEAAMESLPPAQQDSLARRVAWAAVDSGVEQQLVTVFKSTTSEFFRHVLDECRRFEDCATAMSSNTSLERTREG